MYNNSFIEIKNLKIYAYHGVFEDEKKNGQNFFVSAKLYTDFLTPALSDSIDDAINYGTVCEFITDTLTGTSFDLIETCIHNLANEILLKFNGISKISIKISKPEAPVMLPFEDISVNTTKSWHTAYIGIGSNMGDSQKIISDAINVIESDRYCTVKKIAPIIKTKPYGYTEQDDFFNTVIEIKTLREPDLLLKFLQETELSFGRRRLIHWGPRTLDLDILFYDDLITSNPLLTLPHPEIEKREFVLTSLRDIAPNLVHPLLKKRIRDISI